MPDSSVHAATTKPVRVGIVDDDPHTSAWLEASLRAETGYLVVGCAASLMEGFSLLTAAPDVMLIDLGLPDGSGLDLIAHIQQRGLRVCNIVLSVFGDAATVVRAIECGVSGYLLKDAEPAQITQAITSVLAGGAPISPAIAAHVLSRLRASLKCESGAARTEQTSLTPKELAVLQALARGLSFKEVAHELSISAHTVSDHVKAIYRKLAVNSRAEAVYAALQTGLVQLGS